MKCSVCIVCPSVLICSNLKLRQTLEVKNVFKQENRMLQLTFNPGLTLTCFQTTRPCWAEVRINNSSDMKQSSLQHYLEWLPTQGCRQDFSKGGGSQYVMATHQIVMSLSPVPVAGCLHKIGLQKRCHRHPRNFLAMPLQHTLPQQWLLNPKLNSCLFE